MVIHLLNLLEKCCKHLIMSLVVFFIQIFNLVIYIHFCKNPPIIKTMTCPTINLCRLSKTSKINLFPLSKANMSKMKKNDKIHYMFIVKGQNFKTKVCNIGVELLISKILTSQGYFRKSRKEVIIIENYN